MGAERLPLRHAPARAGTEQIHAGLPHRHHSFGVFAAGPLHLGQGGVEIICTMVGLKTRLQTIRAHLADARMQHRLIRVNRQRHLHPRQLSGQLQRRRKSGQLAGTSDHAIHPHHLGPLHQLRGAKRAGSSRRPRALSGRNRQMGVVIHNRLRQAGNIFQRRPIARLTFRHFVLPDR